MVAYCADCGTPMHGLYCPKDPTHHGTITKSVHTDAGPSVGDHTPIIFLAGAIKYWWDENWNSPAHRTYLQWRKDVRAALIEADYLTYAPHEALKGIWNESAQAINDAAIKASDLMLIVSSPATPSKGTDDERDYADSVGTPWIYAPPATGIDNMLFLVKANLGIYDVQA